MGADRYRVVINHEEQYSLWPADQGVPAGWNDTRAQGSREDCMEFIQRAWRDMRPLTLRKTVEDNTRRLEASQGGRR